MVSGQKIQVGLAHARKTAEVAVEAGTYQITVEPCITITAPRTDTRRVTASGSGRRDGQGWRVRHRVGQR